MITLNAESQGRKNHSKNQNVQAKFLHRDQRVYNNCYKFVRDQLKIKQHSLMKNDIFRQNSRVSGRIFTHFLLRWNVGLGNPCRIDLPIFRLAQKQAQECQGISAAQPMKARRKSRFNFYADYLS